MPWLTRAFGGDAREPRNVDCALRTALLAILDRDPDTAEEALVRAVRADSEGIEPYLALARLYRVRGEIGRAIRIHQNLLLRGDLSSQQRVVVLADLGADFRQGGFLRRAITSYEEALDHDKRHLEAIRQLTSLFTKVREFPRAIEMARRLAKLEGAERGPSEAPLYVEMARSAHADGNNDEARRSVKKALRRDKRCMDAWVLLGELETERGRSKAALAAWARAAELDPTRGARVYPQLEASYAALDRAQEFEDFLRRILESHPGDPVTRRTLARTLAARGDVDAAVAELRGLLEHDSDDLETRVALGRILLAESRDREVVEEHDALIRALERGGLSVLADAAETEILRITHAAYCAPEGVAGEKLE